MNPVKQLLLTLILLSAPMANACMCVADSGPLDSEDAVLKLARRKADLGRGSKVDKAFPELIRTYPTLLERLTADELSKSSCGYKGPTGVRHHICSDVQKRDYRVVVRNSTTECEVIVHSKATPRVVRVWAISKNCIDI